ncbi:hypothetical protein J2847_006440 [Azospirillum agricola]|uniref:hypothetical protein n=1 Tax=Azospirillum agricola TaxID=1720247 RepID=UPI001AE5F9BD|nr:hypothetical protein [Azospirillum agricola]MBP2233105.1 hypothetical protein [Azospirillum agricola]
MAITPRVKPAPKPPVDEAAVDRVINRGLARADTEPAAEGKVRRFSFRAPVELMERIEAEAKKRPGTVSANTWLLEAAYEKLGRAGSE